MELRGNGIFRFRTDGSRSVLTVQTAALAVLLMMIPAAVRAQQPSADVTLLDGSTSTGTLLALDSEKITVRNSEGTESEVPFSSAVSVRLSRSDSGSDTVAADESATGVVTLQDGSVLRCREVQVTANEGICAGGFSGALTLPRERIRSVSLQQIRPEWRRQWSSLQERRDERDLLVYVKKDGSGLDFLPPGIVSSISSDSIVFLLDGDELPVPRERVFGVVFPQQETLQNDSPLKLHTRFGDQIGLSSVRLDGESFAAAFPWGTELRIPVNDVDALDLSEGRFRYLSDLEPLSAEFLGHGEDTGGSSADPEFADIMKTAFRPRMNETCEGRALRLGGRTWARGVWMCSRSRIVFPLDGQYRKFESLVGIDDAVSGNVPGAVTSLVISADGQELYSGRIGCSDDPLSLSLDVSGAQTLTIETDFGDGSFICDFLDLADARLLSAE